MARGTRNTRGRLVPGAEQRHHSSQRAEELHGAVGVTRGKKCVLVALLCSTLCDPRNYSLPGSSVYGIL